jgi:hypothetical protein
MHKKEAKVLVNRFCARLQVQQRQRAKGGAREVASVEGSYRSLCNKQDAAEETARSTWQAGVDITALGANASQGDTEYISRDDDIYPKVLHTFLLIRGCL